MYNFYNSDSEESRKDREKQFRKNEILNAAVGVFSTKGYIKATLEEIAEKSEFGKATLYNYFDSKEAIYKEIIQIIFMNYNTLLKQIDENSENFIDFLSKVVKRLFELLTSYPEFFMLIFRTRVDILLNKEREDIPIFQDEIQILDELMTKWIEKGIQDGEIENIDSRKFNHLFRSMVFPYIGDLIHKCTDLNGMETDQEGEFLVSILLNGIVKK